MKLLMVCLGNICRSPLAEGIMQNIADQQKLNWEVDSAGTGNWHIGHGPDHRSVRTARNRGVDISQQVCRQIRVKDFDNFDRILVMDRQNLLDVKALARNENDLKKIQLLLVNEEVPDPYYDDQLFSPVFDLIEKGCQDFIRSNSLKA